MHLNPEMVIPELLRHVMIVRALQHELIGRRSLEETHELGNVIVNSERRVKDNAAKVNNRIKSAQLNFTIFIKYRCEL